MGITEKHTQEGHCVLNRTSTILGKCYPLFNNEKMAYFFCETKPYTDPSGKLKLSEKQMEECKKWIRASKFCSSPVIIRDRNWLDVKQQGVRDCSLIASLIVCAHYERNFSFREPLISNIIFPQDETGKPVFNPHGKYGVKLQLNGAPRLVVIDDFFPVNAMGKLVCAHSQDKQELWVSILEKAYLKVLGGYDKKGSKSDVNLHALTGWIPERLRLRPFPKQMTFSASKMFNMLQTGLEKGNLLATAASSKDVMKTADNLGLQSRHAYAILEVRLVEGIRLVKLKNPWSRSRWLGKFSHLDLQSWTSSLRTALTFEPELALRKDDGVFWMQYEDFCQYFQTLNLNWNPSLFPHTYVLHRAWTVKKSSEEDDDISQNPQFILELNGRGTTAQVWVLVTRHFTDPGKCRKSNETVALAAYDNEGIRVQFLRDSSVIPGGFPHEGNPSLHYLGKFEMKVSRGQRYTLVVLQFSSRKSVHYTLRVYSEVPVHLASVEEAGENVSE